MISNRTKEKILESVNIRDIPSDVISKIDLSAVENFIKERLWSEIEIQPNKNLKYFQNPVCGHTVLAVPSKEWDLRDSHTRTLIRLIIDLYGKNAYHYINIFISDEWDDIDVL